MAKRKEEQEEKEEGTKELYARTGCLLLDMAIGGDKGVFGIPYGVVIGLAGDSSSGKTFLAWEIVAASYHDAKKNNLPYSYRFNQVEAGSRFDPTEMWGIPDDEEEATGTVEELDADLGIFLKKLNKEDGVGIYVLDSVDGLSSESGQERAEERVNNMEKGKDAFNSGGSRNVDIPSFLSKELFKNRTQQIEKSNAVFVCLSQLRDNMDASPYAVKKKTSGGSALLYYQSYQVWLTTKKKLTKTVNGKDYIYGCIIEATLKKGRSKRPFRSCQYVIYFSNGIMNIESNLLYLYDLLDERSNMKAAANYINWGSGATKELTDSSHKDFLKENDLEAECKAARKEIEGKICGATIPATWAKEWINKHATPEVKAKFVAEYGEVYTYEELCDAIYANPEMEKELERRVIAKWEEIEDAVDVKRPKKYAD